MVVTDINDLLEAERRKIQYTLDSQKTQLERNKLGQFATPTIVAADMLAYAKSLLPETQDIRFLDPAIGTGSFFSALLRSFPHSCIRKAVGYEIDPIYSEEASKLWEKHSLQINIADFTRILPPQDDDATFNLLVCNPPYIRHHYLSKSEKQRLQTLGIQKTGIKLSEQAGFYCHFLFASHNWMAQNGLAGWLMPAEFMSVNYGQQVKKYLLNNVTLKRIHCFDVEHSLFDDALVSSCIVWFVNTLPKTHSEVEFSYGGTLACPDISRFVPKEMLQHTTKWTLHFATGRNSSKHVSLHKRSVLADFFDIKRGVATGCNQFFIVDEERVARYTIPQQFLSPVLPGARYLNADEIQSDEKGYPLIKRQLFLLTCTLPEVQVQVEYPQLWSYLQEGMSADVHKGYICSHRTPWYMQEHRSPTPFLCSYMGRQNGSRGKPFRFILNHSKAIATNTYHLLYPKPYLQELLDSRPELVPEIWQALNTIQVDVLLNEGRAYGGGLYKMEPRELGNVPADSLCAYLDL